MRRLLVNDQALSSRLTAKQQCIGLSCSAAAFKCLRRMSLAFNLFLPPHSTKLHLTGAHATTGKDY